MPNPFNENKLPVCVRLGSSWQEEYSVEITNTASGQEHRRLRHPFPARRTTVYFTRKRQDLFDDIVSFYHRHAGSFIGFRIEAYDDNSTNGMTGAPTMADQPVLDVSPGRYQLVKTYGTTGGVRIIHKPQPGSVLVAVAGVAVTPASIDYATGQFTLAAPPANNTDITAGCRFDLPARFDGPLQITPLTDNPEWADTNQFDLVELLEP
jgi:uncharacterized protein (TIGR02217 family)